MGKLSDIYENKDLNKRVQTFEGFSFPALLITPIWCFMKGLYLQAIISLLGFTGIGLIIWIIAGMKGNEWYKEHLIKNGYKRVIEESN